MKAKQFPTENKNQHQKKGEKNDLKKFIEKTKKQNEVLKKMIEKINDLGKTKKNK